MEEGDGEVILFGNLESVPPVDGDDIVVVKMSEETERNATRLPPHDLQHVDSLRTKTKPIWTLWG